MPNEPSMPSVDFEAWALRLNADLSSAQAELATLRARAPQEARMTKLTEAEAKMWHMREAAHYNGGKVFFAYLHRCVEQPRLSRFDRYERKDRSVTSTWRVDGADRASFADAVEALNSPPIFTPGELEFLASAPGDYEAERREGLDYQLADQVRNKGAIEFESGRYRITPAGRAALNESTPDRGTPK